MALARVVTFEDVDNDRIASLRDSIESGERPEGLPASEMILLHDAGAGRALAIMVFDSEDDYRAGDETLNAMPADDTPGRRTSVAKYEIAVRRSL